MYVSPIETKATFQSTNPSVPTNRVKLRLSMSYSFKQHLVRKTTLHEINPEDSRKKQLQKTTR